MNIINTENVYQKYKEENIIQKLFQYFYVNPFKNIDSIVKNEKNIIDFCKINNYYNNDGGLDIESIKFICDKLVDIGVWKRINVGKIKIGIDFGESDKYFINIKEENINDKRIINYFNSQIFGFYYLYDYYKPYVKPIVYIDKDGNITMGTCFEALNGIFTARHCITDNRNVMIKGYSASELNDCQIYFHENEDIDIAFINTKKENSNIYINNGNVLEEVLVLGYPKIPGYKDYLLAEKATVSSISDKRFTATKGNITSIKDNYLLKSSTILITAKIGGGNSGGPIIAKNGSIVGIAVASLESKGKEDNFGYGIGIPSQYMLEILTEKGKICDKFNNYFVDWNE